MDETEEKWLHEYEKRLDEYHKSLGLWARRRPEAVYAVMGVLDAPYHLRLAAPALTEDFTQQHKALEEGVSQALRWLIGPGNTSVRSIANRDLHEEAAQFCMHASDYVRIADFHMSCGRGWAVAHVDPSLHTVTFEAIEGPGPSAVMTWHGDFRNQAHHARCLAKRLKASDFEHAEEVLREVGYRLSDGHVLLDRLPDDLIDKTGGAFRLFREFELVQLSPTADMLGFTMGEFWMFIDAITLWSHAAFIRYSDCVARGLPQEECMPTQIVGEDEFVEQISRLSRLSVKSVEAVRDRLTYSPGPKGDILLTPFLRGEGSICWSPTGVINYAHERNLLKVMSRGTKLVREHAATINGARARTLGRLLGHEFARHGYQFKLDTPIAANGESTDVDLLLYQRARPDEILAIEAKALVSPDEINEVDDATEKVIRAQDQVRCAIRILRSMPISEKRQKFKFVNWDRVTRFFGIVATADVEPHSLVEQAEVPVLTYASLRWRFRPRDFRSPSRFWGICVQRPWQDEEVTEEGDIYQDIKVGDLLYRLPSCIVTPKGYVEPDSGVSRA
jgi:hypothetical protein